MVPGLLLLVARDLLVRDPIRVVAWRLSHHPSLAELPSWLAGLLPRAAPGLDRDPVALLLAALAVGLAFAYGVAASSGARARWRAGLLSAGGLALVVLPTLALVGMGALTQRPYGQDGGVVQLPLALEAILDGESPYAVDYSDTILGRQSRVSSFWAPRGGNPILRHHAYLPGTHWVMLPFHVLSKAVLGFFDPRFVTLVVFGLLAWLASRFVRGGPARLTAAALVLVNPLLYWHQVFGANDVLFVTAVLAALLLAEQRRGIAAGALLGLACATKQLAWPFAPFLLAYLSGASGLKELWGLEPWRRLRGPLAAAVLVFAAVLAPLVLLDPAAFYEDIFVYNVGLAGGDNYPLGGTPGLGVANFLIYFGWVEDLGDYFPFGVFYVLFVPLGLLLLRLQLRARSAAAVLLTGSTALLAAVYFSRVAHPNYLVAVGILLPLAVLRQPRAVDVAVVPLLLLALAAELSELSPFRLLWQQALGEGVAPVALGPLAPRAGTELTADPLSLALSATAAGLALTYLAIGVLGARERLRGALAAAGVLLVVVVPALLVVGLGQLSGRPRAQHRWVVQVPADAARLGQGSSPYARPPEDRPLAREAWPTSYRREPPRQLRPGQPRMPPGAGLLSLVTGLRDPRLLLLFALPLLLWICSRNAGPGLRPAAVGLAGLLPPLASGVVFGSPEALTLCGLAGSLWALRDGSPALAGAVLGLTAAVDHRALLVVPFALAMTAVPSRHRLGWAAAAGYLLPVLPVVLLDPGAFLGATLSAPEEAPGVGLVNLLLYLGLEVSTPLSLALMGATLAGLVLLLMGALRRRLSLPAALVLALLLGALLTPGASPEGLALPLVLSGMLLLAQPGRAADPTS